MAKSVHGGRSTSYSSTHELLISLGQIGRWGKGGELAPPHQWSLKPMTSPHTRPDYDCSAISSDSSYKDGAVERAHTKDEVFLLTIR